MQRSVSFVISKRPLMNSLSGFRLVATTLSMYTSGPSAENTARPLEPAKKCHDACEGDIYMCVCVGFGVYKQKGSETERKRTYTFTKVVGVWEAFVSFTVNNCPGIKTDLAQMPLKPTHPCAYMYMHFKDTNSGHPGSSPSFIMNCVLRPL